MTTIIFHDMYSLFVYTGDDYISKFMVLLAQGRTAPQAKIENFGTLSQNYQDFFENKKGIVKKFSEKVLFDQKRRNRSVY